MNYTNWKTFLKRTEDPKYSWLLSRLEERRIPYRRNGHSSHGPICEVPEAYEDDAWSILDTKTDEQPDDADRFHHDNPVSYRANGITGSPQAWDDQEPEDEDGNPAKPVPYMPSDPAPARIEIGGRAFLVHYEDDTVWAVEDCDHHGPYLSDNYDATSILDGIEVIRGALAHMDDEDPHREDPGR